MLGNYLGLGSRNGSSVLIFDIVRLCRNNFDVRLVVRAGVSPLGVGLSCVGRTAISLGSLNFCYAWL